MDANELQNILRVEGVNAKGFGIIPKIVMQDRRLSRNAKVIYAYLQGHAIAGTAAFPSVKKICYDLNFRNEDTFRKHLKQLVEFGYVATAQQRDKRGRYTGTSYTLIAPNS